MGCEVSASMETTSAANHLAPVPDCPSHGIVFSLLGVTLHGFPTQFSLVFRLYNTTLVLWLYRYDLLIPPTVFPSCQQYTRRGSVPGLASLTARKKLRERVLFHPASSHCESVEIVFFSAGLFISFFLLFLGDHPPSGSGGGHGV